MRFRLPTRTFPILAGLAVCFVGFLIIRHYTGKQAAGNAIAVIGELGGRVGSLPTEPFGTSYMVSFEGKNFSRDQLSKLSIINSMHRRHGMAIRFESTNLTAEDLQWLHEVIPRCTLYLQRDGQGDARVGATR